MIREIAVVIQYEEDDIAEELRQSNWAVSEWGAAEIGLLCQDGDGGPAWVIACEDRGEVA